MVDFLIASVEYEAMAFARRLITHKSLLAALIAILAGLLLIAPLVPWVSVHNYVDLNSGKEKSVTTYFFLHTTTTIKETLFSELAASGLEKAKASWVRCQSYSTFNHISPHYHALGVNLDLEMIAKYLKALDADSPLRKSVSAEALGLLRKQRFSELEDLRDKCCEALMKLYP